MGSIVNARSPRLQRKPLPKKAGRKKGPNHKLQSGRVNMATFYKGAVPFETLSSSLFTVWLEKVSISFSLVLSEETAYVLKFDFFAKSL